MQSNCGAEDGDDFQLRLKPVDPNKRSFIGSLATVNSEVACFHAQAQWGDMEFAEFDAPAGNFFDRGDHALPYFFLKRIGGGIPAQKAEADYAENTKQEEESSQNAAPLGKKRLAQRFRSPARISGLNIWLVERRLASHPERSSFIFFSASKSLIFPKTSVSGVATLPVFFISGNNCSL